MSVRSSSSIVLQRLNPRPQYLENLNMGASLRTKFPRRKILSNCLVVYDVTIHVETF